MNLYVISFVYAVIPPIFEPPPKQLIGDMSAIRTLCGIFEESKTIKSYKILRLRDGVQMSTKNFGWFHLTKWEEPK